MHQPVCAALLGLTGLLCLDRPSTMTEGAEAAYKAANHTAFVLGYTGEVGKELVKELAARDLFAKVILVGRREVPLPEGVPTGKFVQKVVDYDRILESSDAFKGADVGFCALGTTRGKSGVEGFIKVDHDYVVDAAKAAKQVGCKHFNLVSSAGTNVNSPLLYPKTKGRAEEDCKAIGFPRLTIFRPAALLCERQESRLLEKIGMTVLSPIFYAFPTAISIPTPLVARAMVNNLLLQAQGVETIENAPMHQLAKTGQH